MHNFWSKKFGFFIKDVREDDAHDDDVSDRKKNKSFYPENGYGLMDANLITHLSKNIFSFYLL